MDPKAVQSMLRSVMSLALVGIGVLGAALAQQGVKQKELVLAKGPYPQSGAVLMVHDSAAKWGVFRPDGSPLSVSGTTTQGLQEAIDYAQKRALPLFVIGGGITPPHTGLPTPSRALSQINCSTPIAVPTGWVNSYHFFGVNLLYDVAHGADPARDFITFDSADMMDWDMHTSQIIYPGNGAAIRFLPAHDNGEDFAGFTGSRFLFGSIAITHATTLAPESTHGTGIRVSMPALGLGLSNGNGLFDASEIYSNEINGGLYGIRVDTPGPGNVFSGNRIVAKTIHGQGKASVEIGTSAVASAIYGNRWDLLVGPIPGATGVSTWGGASFSGAQWGGDRFSLAVTNGANGIVFNASAANNLVLAGTISTGGGSPYVNRATSQTNVVVDTQPLAASAIAVTASPFVYQNRNMKPTMVAITSGTVSAVETSVDGVNWIGVATSTNQNMTLKPGQWVRVTYSALPKMNQIY